MATGRELHKAAVNGDAEAYHHQLDLIAQLPGRDQRLALPMQQTLAHGHATLSTEGAVTATLGWRQAVLVLLELTLWERRVCSLLQKKQ